MNFEEIKRRFKDHELTEVLNTENIKVFNFRNKNGDSNCFQRWIIDRGTLIVTGDNYSSIYRWNDSSISLKFLAGCNLGYFSEKCQADKDGSRQKTYDADRAAQYLKDIAVDRIYDDSENELEIEEEKWKSLNLEGKLKVVSPIICRELDIEDYEIDGIFYHERESEAFDFLRKTENEFMFGIDGWEYGNGLEVLTMTPKMHLAALSVAYEKYTNAF